MTFSKIAMNIYRLRNSQKIGSLQTQPFCDYKSNAYLWYNLHIFIKKEKYWRFSSINEYCT